MGRRLAGGAVATHFEVPARCRLHAGAEARPAGHVRVTHEILLRMTQENVEIVRREYAAFAARDWAALAGLCHPDIEYETLKTAPGVSGRFRGLQEITDFFDSWSDLYAEFRVEAVEIVDVGDQVITVERHSARGLKGSKAKAWVQDSFACLISFKDGRIWRMEEFPTLEQALEAADLRE